MRQVARERLGADDVELARDRGVDVHDGRDRLVEEPIEGVALGVGLEKAPSGQHLPEADPHREHVGPPVDFLGTGLLRRHVSDLAFELARSSHRQARSGARDPEIREASDAVDADENVVRRDVAMHDLGVEAAFRCPCPRAPHEGPRERRERFAPRHAAKWAFSLRGCMEQVARGIALDIFHHEVVARLGGTDLEDGHDVRVMDPRRETRLVEKHLDELGMPREVLVKALDRVEAAEPWRHLGAARKTVPIPPPASSAISSNRSSFVPIISVTTERLPRFAPTPSLKHLSRLFAGQRGQSAAPRNHSRHDARLAQGANPLAEEVRDGLSHLGLPGA